MKLNSDSLFAPTRVVAGIALALVATGAQANFVQKPALQSELALSTSVNTAVTSDVADTDRIDGSTVVLGATSNGGVVSMTDDGKISYTPAAGFTGEDSFTYTASEDGSWRINNVAINSELKAIEFTNTVPAVSSYDNDNPIFPAPALIGTWQDTQNASSPSGIIGRIINLNDQGVEQRICNEGDSNIADMSLRVAWRLQRTVGKAAGYEASITSDPTHPRSGDYQVEVNDGTTFIAGNTPHVIKLEIPSLTLEEYNANKSFALWAQGVDGINPNNVWNSLGVTVDGGVNSLNCNVETTVVVSVTVKAKGEQDNIGNSFDLDEDRDGISDTLEGEGDADGDGIKNYLDRDSDNDGIADIIEAGGVDANGDGAVDNPTDANGDGQDDNVQLTNGDLDGNGVPNSQDVDSNGDGVNDIAETSAAALDTDGDGRIDTIIDADGDGLHDAFDGDVNGDTTSGSSVKLNDTDGDGTPDYAEEQKKSSGGGGGIPWLPGLSLLALTAIIRRLRG